MTARLTPLRVAAIAALTHLVVAGRYGWHRDEFYYVTSGRHLAWGYPDQPPVVPVVARLAAAFPGGVWPLRIMAIAAQVGIVLIAAAITREFGGSRRAEVFAALVTAATPIFIGSSLLWGTTVADQLTWAVLLWLAVRALRTGRWVAVGVAAGIGLETKHTIVVLMGGIFLGLLLTRREELRKPGPWMAGAIALIIWLPNLVWDAQHDWVSLKWAQRLSDKLGGPAGALAHSPEMLVLAGPLFAYVWVVGLRWLWRHEPHRWLVIAAGFAVVVFVATGGRVYYSAPILVALLAAGAVAIGDGIDLPVWRIGIPIAWASTLLVTLPFLPPTAASALVGVSPAMIETYGWNHFAAQVKAARPSGVPILTSNYGEAGALVHDGVRGVYSSHNGYENWGVPPGSDAVVLAVGEFDAAWLARVWTDVRKVAPIVMPHRIKDEETLHHAAIYLCRRPHGTWAEMWPRLKHLD